MSTLYWFAPLILGIAVFYIVYVTQISSESSAAKDRLGINWGSDEIPFVPPIWIKLTSPLLKGGPLNLALSLFSAATVEKWKNKIRTAGLHKNLQAEHILGAKFWLTIYLFSSLFMWVLFGSEPPAPWIPFAAALVGFFLPDIDMKSRIDARKLGVRLGMPYVLDLMTLTMEAGLEFQGAISKVVERAPSSPFIEELAELLKEIQLGKSREEALRKMAEAVDTLEVTSMVAVLISALRMGSPIGPVLREQSDTLRVERLVKAEKLGAQASQKILFPLVFFILPAVFLVIFGPVILAAAGVT